MEQQQDPDLLAPPAVMLLRGDGATVMQRSLSEDIREERDELREAAEQTLNVFMDLNLDGTIRWVSPSWVDVLGTRTEDVQNAAISSLIVSDNKTVFADVVGYMKKDDSRSQIVRFSMRLGPHSKLLPSPVADQPESGPETTVNPPSETIDLEAQGIMVYDTASGDESHTMWMIRPWIPPREIKINLPPLIVNSLGSGAEILASYLTKLAESAVEDDKNQPPPLPVLCRICERQIPPWWFEKHTDLCLQEHTAEMDVQLAQESLTEHRHAIVKVLDALEARKSRSLVGDASPLPVAEYKGLPIRPPPSSNSSSSATPSPSPAAGRSRDRSSGFGHARARSFAIRRPQARIVELLLDLCDTALEISTPAIKESSSTQAPGDLRTQSPQSESRISQVAQWQSPSTNTLEQEQGLALLCADTEKAAKAKVETVLRHRRVIEYAERIRVEFAVIVQDCIDKAMRKAARIAAGRLSDSTESAGSTEGEEEEEEEQPQQAVYEEGFFSGSFDAPSTLALALEKAKISDNPDDRRLSIASTSQKSDSPRECPTPKSNRGAISIPSRRTSRRESMLFDSEAGDSDGSIRSSSVASRPPPRTESPISEFGDLRRQASSRQHQRRSLILPGSNSPRRQESPSRAGVQPPSSPLRVSKPRSLPFPSERIASPEASPMLPSSEFGSPYMVGQHSFQHPTHHHHQLHHHRRQSSISLSATGELSSRQQPTSPRLSAVGAAPMARAVPPSIKDFEVIKPISKGAFGSVYLSKKKSTGEYFAIKVLKKADMVAKNQVTNVKAERAIMMWQGESDFVAKLYWTFSSKDYLYLVMEYLNGGDCASLIKVLGCLPEDWVKKYLGEVVLGVEHLHNRGIVHRDLKPDNLLIDQKGHLKLTDFGLSRMGLIGRQKRALNSGMTEPAPDLLKQGPFARSASIASSRSTSLDLHGLNSQSPSGTPQMTPSDSAGSFGQPSYFNLNSMPSYEARRVSGQRSDSGGSEALSHMISNISLNDVSSSSLPPTIPSPHNEGAENDGCVSPDLPSLQHASTHGSSNADQNKGTPPQTSMPPPNWALFDPEDTNRRFVGTPDYLAPETIRGEPQDETSDWWSVGCIMFEFLFGVPPFNAPEAEDVFENILARRINWPEGMEDEVSPEAKDLINKLLCMEPRDRLGANRDEKYASGGEEIRNHPWFQDVNWDTLLQDVAQFVPQLENPEDTEYFDTRGATLQSFTEEVEEQSTTPNAPNADYADRPHDALSRVRSQASSMKRGLMPLHIPPHVRDLKSRRLSEPVVTDDFGNFAFKNLPVLEKANKDVIQKLRAQALAAQNKQLPPLVSPSGLNNGMMTSPGPVLEGSPVLPQPANQQIQRTLSNAKASQRPQSPSGLSQSNSSPSRVSQPSSPLLVSFHAAPDSRRKASNNGLSVLQPVNPSGTHSSSGSSVLIEVPRVPPSLQKAATTVAVSSPVKGKGAPPPLPLSPQKLVSTPRQTSNPTSRSRSLTVGSQEGSPVAADILSHRNRRSQVFDMSPSSSDNEGDKANALLLRVQRRRQSSRRMSQIALDSGPVFRPLDVLICDDHPVSRMVMEKLLEKLRCRTISATSGPEAVRYAMSDIKFDIVFMEYRLPQISGADVARMIRDTTNTNSHTPIVAITAYLKELQARQHFDSLIEKPISSSKLTEVLGSLCHWKPPSASQSIGTPPSLALPRPTPSSLRQESLRLEDSPTTTSGSSIFANRPGSSFRGSSRGDSIGSSLFGDSEPGSVDDVGGRKSGGDWEDSGLGISQEELITPGGGEPSKVLPLLPGTTRAAHGLPSAASLPIDADAGMGQVEQTRVSVPSTLAVHSPVPVPVPQRSLERLRAKREAIERRRFDGSVDSADDEDDELGLGGGSTGGSGVGIGAGGVGVGSGSVSSGPGSSSDSSSSGSGTNNSLSRQSSQSSRQHYRSKSVLPSSKLGIEMMRANSHDSVVLHNGSETASTCTAEPVTQVVTPITEGSSRHTDLGDAMAAAAAAAAATEASGLHENTSSGQGENADTSQYDDDAEADTTILVHTPPDQMGPVEGTSGEEDFAAGRAVSEETPKVTITPSTGDASIAQDEDPTPRPPAKSAPAEIQGPEGFI
ncbi:serine/threonine-protein kinase [Niveomyces insectorum RCEF 264]|uniref:non-specific serine/threonine protein kinase n=1 Tax=Niveomyces insectorum RCEF 264 TaxID=1081102 RepID=A0A167WYJ8_9HYPO|nr:serine/threonine-protein kinase [Niveomyces insectorum RCEF 264]